EEDVSIQETGLEPLAQEALVQEDVGFQPGMREPVKARLDIPFEDVPGAVAVAQEIVTLFQSIGTRTADTEPVGMAVRQRFLNRIESQQVQSLQGAIGHGRNAERP